ncbi:MAG: ribosome silencing factor [Bacilli bacterium]|nr:ribosome silencing factor [Bacilli bacterium]
MGERMTDLARIVTDAADGKKARDTVVLDIRGLSIIADFFVITTGNSSIHVQSIATGIKERMEQRGIHCRGMEGYDEARWILLDFGDLVAHVFREEERQFYNLERVWGDATPLSISG